MKVFDKSFFLENLITIRDIELIKEYKPKGSIELIAILSGANQSTSELFLEKLEQVIFSIETGGRTEIDRQKALKRYDDFLTPDNCEQLLGMLSAIKRIKRYKYHLNKSEKNGCQ